MKTNMKLVFTAFVILFLLSNFGFSTTRIFPNGTTVIDSRGDLRFNTRSTEANIELEGFQFNSNIVTALHNKDFYASGRNVVLEGSELQFMCPLETANISTLSKNLRLIHGVGGFVEIDNLKFGDNALISKNGNIVVEPSDYIEMRTSKIIGDPLSSDYFNLTSKSSHLKLGTDDSGDILLDAGENHSVKVVASRLDLIGAALNLTGTHVTFDQIISQSLLINGTLITTTDSDVDIILSPQGNGVVRVGSGKTFDVSSATLLLRDDQISGSSIEGGVINAIQINTLTSTTVNSDTLSTNTLTSGGSTVTLAAGKTFDVSSGVLKLADDQISGDKIEGGIVGSIKINNLTAVLNSGVLAAGKTLDLSAGTVQLADNQISGDKINGGTIDSVAITDLTSGQVTVDNVKIDGNTVETSSGDLNLQCGVGSVVKIGDTLQIGKLVMSGNTLNTTDHATLILSPHGLGAVKVAEGKTFDLRGVTLLIDDDAIKRMDNVTINELVGHLIKSGMLTIGAEMISSTGDIRLSPAAGKKVDITKALDVQNLKFEGNTISVTSTSNLELSPSFPTAKVKVNNDLEMASSKKILAPSSEATFGKVKVDYLTIDGSSVLSSSGAVEINNLTCPVASFSKVTVGTLQIEDNEVSCIGASCDVELSAAGTGDVVLKSDVVLGAGKSITGTTSEATFQTVKTSTVSTASGDLTLNPGGQNVKISPSKTLDVTGATLKIDDDSISGDKIEGGSVDQIEVKDLKSDAVSVKGRVQVNGSVEVGSGGVVSEGGTRDSHAWGSEMSVKGQLQFGQKSVLAGGYFRQFDFQTYNVGSIDGLPIRSCHGPVFDGRFIYCPSSNGLYHYMLRLDTQQPFESSEAWCAFDHGAIDGLVSKSYIGGAFDGRFVYFAPYAPQGLYHGVVLRYDTHGEFKRASSWAAYDAINVGGLVNRGYWNAVFDGAFVYFVPHYGDPVFPHVHGHVLRYDTRSGFKNDSSWAVKDVNTLSGYFLGGYVNAVFDGTYVYFVPQRAPSPGEAAHGRVLRLDTRDAFLSSGSWTYFDAGSVSSMETKPFSGGIFDGRFLYLSSHTNRVVRYDTMAEFGASSSWCAFDVGVNVVGVDGARFEGASFDGRFIYFSPWYNTTTAAPATALVILRYDTLGDFQSGSSWVIFDGSSTEGYNSWAYPSSVFDGRYVMFVPERVSSGGISGAPPVVRYDTRSPQPRPSIQQIASNKDLFISSNSNIGIGTTSPTEKLEVSGNAKVSGNTEIVGTLDFGWERVSSNGNIAAGSCGWVDSNCSSGKKIIGGGCQHDYDTGYNLISATPSTDTRYSCYVCNTHTASHTVTARAICARV